MSSIDKVKLLRGLPIKIPKSEILVYPAILDDISFIGAEQFFKYINLLTIDDADVLSMLQEEVEVFNFIFLNCLHKEEFKNEFIDALSFFLKEKDILIIPEMEVFVIGDITEQKFIDENNFRDFQNIMRVQNCIAEEKVKYTGEDEIAKRVKERVAEANKKIARIKQGKNAEEGKIELGDLIGSLTVVTSINIFDVWNISYYAFNDQFRRMRLLEQYNTSVQSIMAGADPKKIKLKDWIQSIQ